MRMRRLIFVGLVTALVLIMLGPEDGWGGGGCGGGTTQSAHPSPRFRGSWQLVAMGFSIGRRPVTLEKIPVGTIYVLTIANPNELDNTLRGLETLTAGCKPGQHSWNGLGDPFEEAQITRVIWTSTTSGIIEFVLTAGPKQRVKGQATLRLLEGNVLEQRIDYTRLRFNEAAQGYIRAGDYHILRIFKRRDNPFFPTARALISPLLSMP